MKLLTVRTLFIGCSSEEIHVNIDEDKSFKQLIDEHYNDLLPWPNRFESSQSYLFGAWENLNDTFLRYFNSCYQFAAFQYINSTTIPVHLIDKLKHIKANKVIIGPLGSRHDDSISFFLTEKYDDVLDIISTERNKTRLREKLRELLEHLLSETDSHILVDMYSRSKAEHRISTFIKGMIPSALWLEITKDSFAYYRKFLLHFADQTLILNYCVDHSNLVDRNIFQDISRGWVDDFLYRIQNLMLVLLSIPEFFLRSIYSSVFNYSELLKGIGIGKLQQKDDDYYRKCIMNRSVSEIYTDIFNAISIDNYPDYIGFCEDVDFSDGDLIKIVQTYRILFNKLKHSSYIQIIKSRDDETIKKNNLKNIEREIEELQAMQYTDEQNVQSKLEELRIRKEVIEKVRYTYAHLDFDDLQFKHNNGIWVVDDKGTGFRITLFDMEIALKVLIGILYVMERATVTAGGKSFP